MSKKCYSKLLLILFALTMILVSSQEVLAASKLSLYYYGSKENVQYAGQQVKYTLDGNTVNMRNTPGIITNGTSLASYKDVFVYSDIDLDYVYNKSKGTVTLSDGNTKIILTIGSKKAYVNGKAVTMSVAPVKVKFKAQNVTKILVPVRFVAENFGYTYSWNSATSTASMKSPLQLYYNGKKSAYSGTLGQVKVDGVKINVDSLPSIIINNTAMIQAKKVFNGSSIKAVYNYDSKTKVLTLTKGDRVVKLTMGDKVAYVNGNPRSMNTAPLVVKNLNTGNSYVMVPGSYVSSFLGYDYRWDSSTKCSIITSRPDDTTDSGNTGNGPELGGDEIITGKTFFQWGIQDGFLTDYNLVKNLTNVGSTSSGSSTSSNLYSVTKEYSSESFKEIYAIHSTSPIGNVTSSLNSASLSLHVENTVTSGNTYYFSNSLSDTISTAYNSGDGSSTVDIHLLNPNIKYKVNLSPDNSTLYVTLYYNYVSSITAGTSGNFEYIQMTGINPLNVTLQENSNVLILTMPYTINGTGSNYINTMDSNLIKSVQTSSINTNSTQVIIELNSSAQYYVSEKNNIYTLSFYDANAAQGPDMQIKLPSGISYSQISSDDRYYNNEFAIIIPGDYRIFYDQNMITSSDSVVNDISISYINGNTEIVVSTSRIQGFKLKENNGYINVTVGNPKDIFKNIVVLDAGHGGTDPGAMRTLNGQKINEKDINFSILYEHGKKYFESEDSDIKVYYSRYDDTKVDLYERAAFAQEVGADLFVSLHMNANVDTSINGTDVYYSTTNNSVTSNGLTSKGLASMILNYLPDAIGTTKRSVRAQDYVVVRENTVPAVLIELAFISNPDDLSLMTDDYFQEETAKALYDVLNIVFDTYPTGR